MWNTSQHRAHLLCRWSVACTLLGWSALGIVNRAAAQTDSDDWPVKLAFKEDAQLGEHARVLTAENLATFNCTRLRLHVSAEGGTLLRGGGQTSARLIDGHLVFDEVPMLKAGERIHWTLHFAPESSTTRTKIIAQLDYAEKPVASRPAPAPVKGTCASYSPSIGRDMSVTELAFPTGNRGTSALLVHKVVPVEVEKGKPYSYQYHVTNLQNCEMQGVEIAAGDFQNLKVVKSTPAAEADSNGYRWRLGNLAECQTKVIDVQATSADVGAASACLTAVYNNRLCGVTNVVEPAIQIAKSATPDHLVCDEAQIVLTVSNPGSGLARNVKVIDELPEGITTVDGKKRIEADAGDLGPSQSKQLTFKVKASKVGQYSSKAMARADGNLTAQSSPTTTVFRQPVLQVSCSAPEERYIGRIAEFCFDVKNTGNAVSTDTVLVASSPVGAEITEISAKGAKQDKGVTWQVGALKPDESQHLCFKARINTATTLQTYGRAAGRCAAPVEAECETIVVGIPAILLEVVDLQDPIEVGTTATYVISVTNQGTAPDTNIRIAAILPEQQEHLSSGGATTSRPEGQRIVFAPLAKLEPKQKAEWKLTVTARKPGDARLAVELTSDQFKSLIRETESTNLYE